MGSSLFLLSTQPIATPTYGGAQARPGLADYGSSSGLGFEYSVRAWI